MASFQNLQIPDIQICASLVLRLNRQEPWQIQGFVMLISILVPNWWLITFRCVPTTWTFQVFSMNSDAQHIKGVGSCVVMMRPDGVGKRAIVLPKMQWVVLGWFHVKGTDLWGVRFESGFFGPKLVSWTAWGALTPILALPGPFKGVFGPRVGFGAPGEPNFPNNQISPLFVIPLSFLHLNSWKR